MQRREALGHASDRPGNAQQVAVPPANERARGLLLFMREARNMRGILLNLAHAKLCKKRVCVGRKRVPRTAGRHGRGDVWRP